MVSKKETMFVIEDETHAELQEGEFATFELALEELKKRTRIPWDNVPNRCPCTSWKTCERKYQIVEYDDSTIPWIELGRWNALVVSAKGVVWDDNIKSHHNI